MTNVAVYSKNQAFAADLVRQIESLCSGYTADNAQKPDVVVIDENAALLEDITHTYDRIPVFVLLKKGERKLSETPFVKYIAKPLILSDFLNTIQSAQSFALSSNAGVLCFNGYELCPFEKQITNTKTAQTIKLTEREVAILLYLYQMKGKIATKNDLLQKVWGYSPDVSTHTIETHIYRLRQKVEKGKDAPALIETKNSGYKLNL